MRPVQPGAELLLVAPGNLIANEQGQELGVGIPRTEHLLHRHKRL